MSDGDLILPMSMDVTKQSYAQQWYAECIRTSSGIQYSFGDNRIDGEFFAFTKTPGQPPVVRNHCQIRFGQLARLSGFKVCLYVQLDNDDKHTFDDIQFDANSQTISGRMGSHRRVVVRVNPFQTSRLRAFANSIDMSNEKTFNFFLNMHKLAATGRHPIEETRFKNN